MIKKRAYSDACATAHALNLVGERWALLIVRELLLGPKRYTDLQAGLHGASPNVLAQRLRELEKVEIVHRRRLGPPASTWVYELTEWGHELDTILVELGRWGRKSRLRDLEDHISIDSIMLALRAHFVPGASKGLTATYSLCLEEDYFSVHVANSQLSVKRGEPSDADAMLKTDTKTFLALLRKALSVSEAMHNGQLKLVGDQTSVEHLLEAL